MIRNFYDLIDVFQRHGQAPVEDEALVRDLREGRALPDGAHVVVLPRQPFSWPELFKKTFSIFAAIL